MRYFFLDCFAHVSYNTDRHVPQECFMNMMIIVVVIGLFLDLAMQTGF